MIKIIKTLWHFGEDSDADYGKLSQGFNRLGIVFGGLGIVAIIVLIGAFIAKNGELSVSAKMDAAIWGQLGDIIGGFVGSLWALTGVFFFVSALFMQKEDLKITRQELRDTREEAELSRKNFELGRAEKNFYTLLSFFRDISENFQYAFIGYSHSREPNSDFVDRSSSNSIKGREAIQKCINDYHKAVAKSYTVSNLKELKSEAPTDYYENPERLKLLLATEFKKYIIFFSDYLKTHFVILKKINYADAMLADDFRDTYIALLTSEELTFLYYQVIISDDKSLIDTCIKFKIFDNLSLDNLILGKYLNEIPITKKPSRIVIKEVKEN